MLSTAYDRDHMLKPPFDRIDPARLERIALSEGALLFREGAPTRGMFGAVDVDMTLLRVTPAGDRVVIHRARRGETFAEASLFAETYHCDARAEGAGTVVCLPKDVVLPLFAEAGFATAYGRLMSRQVQRYRLLVEILSIKRADERVFAAMSAGLLDGKVTDFAASIGLTHEATYRALRRLVRSGRVTQRGRGLYSVRGA